MPMTKERHPPTWVLVLMALIQFATGVVGLLTGLKVWGVI
jgi:hypothetical protein